MEQIKGKFLIVDGSSLVHRAFFALPILTNAAGEYTNAVYGFAMMLNRIISEERPEKVLVCFDKSRVTFRTAIFAEYKGTRSATPSELKPQFEGCKRLLEAMNIAWEEIEGFEADDIIGTVSRLASVDGEALILTGDRDALQLINENCKVMLTKKGITNTELWGVDELFEKYALTPAQMIDLKSLMGDNSDNIPGIAGVGEKTALKLLAEYKDLDTVLENAENVSGKALKAKLLAGKDTALMSRELAIIDRFMEEKFPNLADLNRFDYKALPLAENPTLIEFYEKMAFTTLLKDVSPSGAVAQVEIAYPKVQPCQNLGEISKHLSDATEIAYATFKGLAGFMAYEQFDATAENTSEKMAEKTVFIIEEKNIFEDLMTTDYSIFAKKFYLPDAKDLMVKLKNIGISDFTNFEDVALMAYLLNPTANNYAPHTLADVILNKGKVDEKKGDPSGVLAFGLGNISEVYAQLEAKLVEEKLLELYVEMEKPLTFVLADMEVAGINVDVDVLDKLNIEFSAMEAELTLKIYELAGRSFNINSPKQLGEVLFVEMAIPPVKKTKTGYSTDADVLETLSADHEIAKYILSYRTYAKLRSTYAQGLKNIISADGKIHTSFNQTVTATGRLSSTEPNLQNIPVRNELGRKIRGAFKASAGNVLLSADYSQIELRVLADISGDEVLQNSFFAGEDIHSRTAAEVFGVELDAVEKEQRVRAKAVNFGIVYGISAFGLAKDLGIFPGEAKHYIDTYLLRYEGVAAYMKNIVVYGKEHGFVETLCGRKRWLPDLKNRNFNLRSFAERTALNTPIQGTAADILKLAMLKIAARLSAENLETKMLLQVHDELIFDVPQAELQVVTKLVVDEMANAFDLKVPMVVDVAIGIDWYNMEDVLD